jgi:hypothetical protein
MYPSANLQPPVLKYNFFNVLLLSKPFWESFLSFSRFLLSHASLNPRSELYGRLIPVIIIHLAEEAQKFICGATEEYFQVTVEFCCDVSGKLNATIYCFD